MTLEEFAAAVNTGLSRIADAAQAVDPTLVKLGAVGASSRPLVDRLAESISVKDFAAAGDGYTDDSCAINTAISWVSSNGGGTVTLPKGAYVVGSSVTLKDNVTLQGAGVGATIIRRKGGVTMDAVVCSQGAYSLWGSGSLAGPKAVNIRDLAINGDVTSGGTCDGLAIYGALFSIDNVEVTSCSGIGVRTEFGTPGAIPHGYCAQSNMNNCWVHDCNTAGVKWAGPADPSILNCNIYRNLNYNLWLTGPTGTGCKVVNCHVWGSTFDYRQATTGIRVDSPGNLLVNCVAEGSTSHQIHLRSGANYVLGGNQYYKSDAANTYGVVLGDTGVQVASNTIITRVDDCRAGAIYLANSAGLNHINVQGYNTSSQTTTGLAGSPALSDYVLMQVAGNAAVVNGSLVRLPGMGSVVTGAPDSGGAGFRALRVLN